MRVKLTRFLCVTLFFLVPHLFWQGCTSAQSEQEISAEEEGYDEGNEYADEEGYEDEEGEEGEGGNEYAEGENEYGEEEGYENSYGNEEGGDEYADGEDSEDYENYEGAEGEELADNQLGNQILDGEQTKSDLENIIAGQNADAAEEIPANVADAEVVDANAADAGYDAAAANAVPAAAPSTPGVAAGPALPETGSKMPYVVRVGETLSMIAQKVYGSSDKWQEMAELTSISNPDLVKPGDVVYYQLTEETLAFASAYEGAGREMVTVQPGDTLAGIAQRVYGAAGDWKFIWRQNGDIQNPDRLEVGQTLYYVNPAGLSAAIDKLKTMTIADLIKETFDKEDPQGVELAPQLAETAPAQMDYSFSHNSDAPVNGFQIAKTMFSTFTTNLGIAG